MVNENIDKRILEELNFENLVRPRYGYCNFSNISGGVEDLVLRPEIAEELRKRIKEVEDGSADLVSHEELSEQLG